jgi:AcrR family transcriptional regulator
VTVEAVASRSGVAKTTIYRRFANRREMLQAALVGLARAPEPGAGRARPPRRFAGHCLGAPGTSRRSGLSSVGAILAGDDREFSESVRDVLNPYIEHLVVLLESAVAAGNVRTEIDADTVLSLILGALPRRAAQVRTPAERVARSDAGGVVVRNRAWATPNRRRPDAKK